MGAALVCCSSLGLMQQAAWSITQQLILKNMPLRILRSGADRVIRWLFYSKLFKTSWISCRDAELGDSTDLQYAVDFAKEFRFTKILR